MSYLICYDIEDDYDRKKIHDHLLAAGLTRVQYSVFVGNISETVFKNLLQKLEKAIDLETTENDNILILDLTPKQLKKIQIIGKSKIDLDELAGDKNSLFW